MYTLEKVVRRPSTGSIVDLWNSQIWERDVWCGKKGGNSEGNKSFSPTFGFRYVYRSKFSIIFC